MAFAVLFRGPRLVECLVCMAEHPGHDGPVGHFILSAAVLVTATNPAPMVAEAGRGQGLLEHRPRKGTDRWHIIIVRRG
ncbi:hypothetical protein LIA77_01700 [Sarocladium implicatum]|nr:hypothetical protein LIA77_01700 [Sarocladium implicatum]